VYSFEYEVVRKGPRFDDRFFAQLAAIGRPGPRTLYQSLYNGQLARAPDVEVPEQVLYVDAPSIERWLDVNDARSERCYTIYFVSGWGRSDFRFHVYTRSGDPDPDTRYDFAALESRKLVAWGGRWSRSWFYDFSAGPEFWGSNYVVDRADADGDGDLEPPDLDGDSVSDNVIPVIWEYREGGYRDPARLGTDMGLLARFVAINLQFTPSPVYDPLLTAPEPLGSKVAHVTMLEDVPDPAQRGASFFDPAVARDTLRSLAPYHRWRVELRDQEIDAGAKRALDIFSLNLSVPDCWTAFGTTFAQPYCYFAANLDAYVPSYAPRDYVAPVLAFNTTDEGIGRQFGLLGYADDDWRTGGQSFVFAFGTPGYRDPYGYGYTATTIHELGHHFGLSHPHDGYDSELGIDYNPTGFLFFAWLGDESETVMNYLAVSHRFGRHDRDNLRRWEAAGYLNWANALAGELLASPVGRHAEGALGLADRHAARARGALERWDYLAAASEARWAYALLARSAEELGLRSARLALARTPLPGVQVAKSGCRPRFPPQERPGAP
jgi:hypothetical protein